MSDHDAADVILGVALVGGVAAAVGVGVSILHGRGRASGGDSPAPPTPTPAPSSSQPRAREQAAMSNTNAIIPKHITQIYTPSFWAIVLAPRVAIAKIPLQFALDSITEESGGNPCAIGNPSQYGPDGVLPREMGIYQFYNPDDLKFLHVDGHDLRAYCNPNKVQYANGVMGPSQEVIRELTPEELSQQADMTVGKINRDRAVAASVLHGVGATWPAEGAGQVDFWRAVKLVHGLPGILGSGMPAFKAKYGHAPKSWVEFRRAIESGDVHCDHNTEPYRPKFHATFDNAEHAARNVPGGSL